MIASSWLLRREGFRIQAVTKLEVIEHVSPVRPISTLTFDITAMAVSETIQVPKKALIVGV